MYIVFNAKQRGRHALWTNINKIHSNSNILQLSVLSEEAKRYDKLNDLEIIIELLETLRSMFPQANISRPIDYALKRWNSDPFQRGAWSIWPISFTEKDQIYKSMPVGRIYFAGEYIHPTLSGYVNGAYETGLNTANDILKCIRKKGDCQVAFGNRRNVCVFGESCSTTHVYDKAFNNIINTRYGYRTGEHSTTQDTCP